MDRPPMEDSLLFECKTPDFSLLELLSPPCLEPPDPGDIQLSAADCCLQPPVPRMGVQTSPPIAAYVPGGATGVTDRFLSDTPASSLAPHGTYHPDSPSYEVPESAILCLLQEAAKLDPLFISPDSPSMGSGPTPDPQEGGHSPRTAIIHPAPDSQEGGHSPRRVSLPPGLWAEGLMGADEVSEDPPPVPAAFGGVSVPTSAAAADSVAADVQREGVGRFGGKGQDGADHCPVQHLVSPPDPHTHPLPPVRTRTPRKQPHPQRSAQSGDPSFEGVTVCMERELVGPLNCRLHITARYSPGLQQKLTRFRSHRETTLTSHLSSSEEDPCPGHERMRRCASCGTQRTPLWRDAEDGTPLCNACGIRYKKYRIRCPKCWHIPKKEGKCFVRCLRCGDPLRLLMNARKGASC